MVEQHYRWDFIGLSTDVKPTPATSEKVVNGSTFYCSDNSKLYVWYKTQWYEKTATGGGGSSYTAGSGITISDNTISVDTTTIQPKLTAGSNITIGENNEISATDTTYSNFTGTDGTSAGTAGLVPAPLATDTDKFLKSNGTWATAGGGTQVIKKLTSADYDYPTNNPSCVALWLLPAGAYIAEKGTATRAYSTQGSISDREYLYLINYDEGNDANIIQRIGGQLTSVNSYASNAYLEYFTRSNGSSLPNYPYGLIPSNAVKNNLTTTSSNSVLDARQGKELKTLIDNVSVTKSEAPTTSTAGVLGQLYTDTTNMHTYQCTAIDTTDPDNPSYTWTQRW